VDTIARKLRQIFHVERSSVYLIDAGKGALLSRSAFHNGAQGCEIAVPIGVGPAGRAAESHRTMNVGSLDRGETYGDLPALGRLRVESALAVPVHAADGRLIAVAELINRTGGGAFTPAEQRRLEEFAVQLVGVLERCAAMRLQSA